jgi:hypothetical protein
VLGSSKAVNTARLTVFDPSTNSALSRQPESVKNDICDCLAGWREADLTLVHFLKPTFASRGVPRFTGKCRIVLSFFNFKYNSVINLDSYSLGCQKLAVIPDA